jgi:hypothetical protein
MEKHKRCLIVELVDINVYYVDKGLVYNTEYATALCTNCEQVLHVWKDVTGGWRVWDLSTCKHKGFQINKGTEQYHEEGAKFELWEIMFTPFAKSFRYLTAQGSCAKCKQTHLNLHSQCTISKDGTAVAHKWMVK